MKILINDSIGLLMQGKGSMKTYWLLERTAPTSSFLPRSTSQLLSPSYPSSRRGSDNSEHSRATKRSAAYTPVTFDAVSKSHMSIKSLMAAAYADDGQPAGTAQKGNGSKQESDAVVEIVRASGCQGHSCASNTCSVM